MQVHEMMSNDKYVKLFDEWLDAHGFQPEMLKTSNKKASDLLKRNYAKCVVAGHICKLIDRYGEDGYGDKSEEMDTVEYWLAHIDFERLKENQFQ